MMEKKSIIDLLEEMMIAGDKFTPYILQTKLNTDHGRFHSDSTITMALRKLRKRGYDVVKERIEGQQSYLYYIKKQGAITEQGQML